MTNQEFSISGGACEQQRMMTQTVLNSTNHAEAPPAERHCLYVNQGEVMCGALVRLRQNRVNPALTSNEVVGEVPCLLIRDMYGVE